MTRESKAAAAMQRPFSSTNVKGFKMPKLVRFSADFYDTGEVKFAAGKFYPLNSETQSLVSTGYAELVDAGESVDQVEVLQALADLAVAAADAANANAEALAKAAYEAVALVDTARLGAAAAAPKLEKAAAAADDNVIT
jgi:hypothetical protein